MMTNRKTISHNTYNSKYRPRIISIEEVNEDEGDKLSNTHNPRNILKQQLQSDDIIENISTTNTTRISRHSSLPYINYTSSSLNSYQNTNKIKGSNSIMNEQIYPNNKLHYDSSLRKSKIMIMSIEPLADGNNKIKNNEESDDIPHLILTSKSRRSVIPNKSLCSNNTNNKINMQDNNNNTVKTQSFSIIPPVPEVDENRENQPTLKISNIQNESSSNGSIVNNLNTFASRNLKNSKIKSNSPIIIEKIRLFDNFFIIGVDKSQLIDNELSKSSSAYISPKYLYTFPSNFCDNNGEANIILRFFFPRGVNVALQKLDSNIDEILWGTNMYSLNNDSFVFVLKSPLSFEDEKKGNKLLEESNPSKNRYCVCIKVKDYVSCSNTNSIWVTEMIYCFITYYPLFSLFFNLLQNMIFYIKHMKILKFIAKDDNNNSNSNNSTINNNKAHKNQWHSPSYTGLDSSFSILTLIKEIESKLYYYYNNTFNPDFNDILFIDLFQLNNIHDQIEYHISDNTSLAYTLESSWALPRVFSYLSLNDLLLFYKAIIVEMKIIIVSQNISLLTGTLFTFLALIKPLQYTGQLIFILPEYYFEMIEAPGFYLYGIHGNRDYLISKNIFHNYKNHEGVLYVCLDERIIYTTKKLENELQFPLFKDFQLTLTKDYYEINKERKFTFQIFQMSSDNKILTNMDNKLSVSSNKINSHYANTTSLINECLKVLENFKNFFNKRVIDYLPKNPIYDNSISPILDPRATIKIIEKSNPYKDDKIFISKLTESQTFLNYVYNHYTKNCRSE